MVNFSHQKLLKEIMKITNAEIGDSIFMSCSKEIKFTKLCLNLEIKLEDLEIIDQETFAFVG